MRRDNELVLFTVDARVVNVEFLVLNDENL